MLNKRLLSFLCFTLLIFNILCVVVPKSSALTWWDNDWTSCLKVTIDHNDIGADLTNFPVLVYLDNTRVNWSLIQDNLNDLRFTVDNSTLLKYEIDNYVINDKAWIWVKIPSISSTVDTVFYIYFNNPYAPSGSDPENVWDANFVMVQHMKDATISTILDSTSNNNDGAKKGAGEPVVTTLGKIDDAQNFDANNDYVDCGDINAVDGATLFTFEAWVKWGGAVGGWAGSKDFQRKENVYAFGGGWTARKARLYVWFTVGGLQTTGDSITNIDDGNWHYIVGSYDGVALRLYIEGLQENSANFATKTLASNTNKVYLGSNLGTGEFWNGMLEEQRISNINRSDAWILASYETGRDHLLTYGSGIVFEITIMAVEMGILAFIIAITALCLVFLKK